MQYLIQLKGDEQTIIEACVQKEKWAQKEIYETFYSPMYSICLRYARHDQEASDLVHEGFIKVFRYIDKYSPGTSLYSWIKRVIINNCIDYYRKESRRRTENLDTVYGASIDNPSALSELSHEEILGAIQQLTDSYRAVFNLYVIEGYAHKEIAEKLNISESTSRSNLVKARTKLKAILAQMGFDVNARKKK